MSPGAKKGFLQRLEDGEQILIAEGYLFEFERRGYLKAGPFVPEVVLENPEMVKALHEEFVHAGSDVVLAFTYYAQREKLRLVGREDQVEEMNRTALKIAKEVADATGTLFAGNLCNTTAYTPEHPESHKYAAEMFEEQIGWVVDAGADFIIMETIVDYGEGKLALDCIKKFGNGIPAVITFAANSAEMTRDGYKLVDAIKLLLEAGAAVVGINCSIGPLASAKLLRKLRAEIPKGRLAAVPVPYRTTDEQEMIFLRVPETGKQAFPRSLDYFYCTDDDIAEFGKACVELKVQYLGLCCGNSSRYFRYLAESVGRSPPASKYSPDMSKHWIFGEDKSFCKANQDMRETHWTPNKSGQ